MARIYIEQIFTNHEFSGLGVAYKKREQAVAHLRKLKEEQEQTVTHYSETMLFIVYKVDGRKIEVDFERTDLL